MHILYDWYLLFNSNYISYSSDVKYLIWVKIIKDFKICHLNNANINLQHFEEKNPHHSHRSLYKNKLTCTLITWLDVSSKTT